MEKQKKKIIWEYAEAIVTALILALFIRAFFIQAFKIPTGSMVPTLQVGDQILVNKFIYGTELPFTDVRILEFQKPSRGDIIVFKYPEDRSRDFIKRVVAVGGDTVESLNKQLYINGKPVKESYVIHNDRETGKMIEPRDNFGPVVVPPGKYFVMGDNRDHSYDSRYWGFVDREDIEGEALIIYWSWNKKNHRPRFDRIGDVVE